MEAIGLFYAVFCKPAEVTSHAVQLALPVLQVRQTHPFLAMAGHFPTNLEVKFRLASAGADQVWLDTQSSGKPMDFTEVQCHMAADEGRTSVLLFGRVSCHPGGHIDMEVDAVLIRLSSRLRVDFSYFDPTRLYTLKARNIRLGFAPGPADLTVASSTAARSINSSDFSQAVLLDRSSSEDRGGFQVAGQLRLQALGSGSFASLSADAMFGTASFIVADRWHFLTIAFVLQVPVLANELLVVYPATGVDLGDEVEVALGLAALGSNFSTSLWDLSDHVDDIFSVHNQLNLQRPSYSQRLDLVFSSPPTALPANQVASVQLYARARFVPSSSQSGWLLLTSRRKAWAQVGVTNTNIELWPEGQLQVVPSFDPRTTMVSFSSTASSALILVTLLFVPSIQIQSGSWLRVTAPDMFVWYGPCLEGSTPPGLVKTDQCKRGLAPHILLLLLILDLEPGTAAELWMQVLTPPQLSWPNLWEVAALQMEESEEGTTSTASTTKPGFFPPMDAKVGERDLQGSQSSVLPLQLTRLDGFQLDGLEAALGPMKPLIASDEAGVNPLLLSFRLRAAPQLLFEELQLAATPLRVKLTAPYPVVVMCPSPHMVGVEGESRNGTMLYESNVSSRGWRLLSTQQRLARLVRCTPLGWRGEPEAGEEATASATSQSPGLASTESSFVVMEIGSPMQIGDDEWVALPVQAHARDQLLAEKASRSWALELLGDYILARTELVGGTPNRLMAFQAPLSPLPLSLSLGRCSGPFCAALAADSTQEAFPAAALLVGRGRGVRIDFAISLSKALKPTAAGLAGSRWTRAFNGRSEFNADIVLGSFIQLTAPQPLKWLNDCSIANTSGFSPGIWRCVCDGNSAYLHIMGYSQAPSIPLREVLTIQGVSLASVDAENAVATLPLSTLWVAAWYEDGALLHQLLVESHWTEDVLDMSLREELSEESNGTDQSSQSSAHEQVATVELEQDSQDLEECLQIERSYYPCPRGMYAYGIRAVSLGASDSLNSVQLLCREELDIGTNHTQWQPRSGATGVIGNRQLLTLDAAHATLDSTTTKIACDEGASGLLVGLTFHGQGLTAACMPWALVEREMSWLESGEESSSLGAESPAGNCTGLVPINGSENWADCQGIQHLRPCPNPDKCCCNKNFQYSELSQTCDACQQQDSADVKEQMRLCPLGMAVVGLDAWESQIEHEDLPSPLLISTICSLRLHCGPLNLRHWSGMDKGPKVSAFWEPLVEDAGLELPGLANLGSFEWWHYAAAAGAALLLLCCCYRCCCRTSQANVFGDVQPKSKVSQRRVLGLVILPFSLAWGFAIKPVAAAIFTFILEPFWRRALQPVLAWLLASRLARIIGGILRRLWKLLTYCCPCLRRFERFSAKQLWQTIRNPVAASKNARAKVARRLELRRQVMAGTFSAEKSKDDLVNQLKRGEIDEDELAIRQREIDDLVKTVQLMSDKKSMVDRMKKSKESLKSLGKASKEPSHNPDEEGSQPKGVAFCCCRRLPTKSIDEEDFDIPQAHVEVETEAQPDEKLPQEGKDNDEGGTFGEEEWEEEGVDDDEIVDPSSSSDSSTSSDHQAPGPVSARPREPNTSRL